MIDLLCLALGYKNIPSSWQAAQKCLSPQPALYWKHRCYQSLWWWLICGRWQFVCNHGFGPEQFVLPARWWSLALMLPRQGWWFWVFGLELWRLLFFVFARRKGTRPWGLLSFWTLRSQRLLWGLILLILFLIRWCSFWRRSSLVRWNQNSWPFWRLWQRRRMLLLSGCIWYSRRYFGWRELVLGRRRSYCFWCVQYRNHRYFFLLREFLRLRCYRVWVRVGGE